MVIMRYFVIFLLILPGTVLALDEYELRSILAPAENDHAKRNSRAKVSDGLSVPGQTSPTEQAPIQMPQSEAPPVASERPQETNTGTSADTGAVQVQKYGSKPSQAAQPPSKQGSRASQARSQRSAPQDPDIYIPPPRISTVSTTETTVFNDKAGTFGIVLGTWIKAKLVRQVSSADGSAVEVEIIEDVAGRRQVLPAGTVLFGTKRFNSTSERLDVTFLKGITPDDQEFNIQASLYDQRQVSGLDGMIVRRRQEEVSAAAQAGALTAVSGIVSAAAGSATGDAVSAGLQAGSSELIDNERQYIKKPEDMIQVQPQSVLIRIDKTF